MKLIAKLFSFLFAIAAVALTIYWWMQILNRTEEDEDPYYFYGDSMYRGDHGEPLRFESDEEKEQRLEKESDSPFVPDGYSQNAG